MWGKQSRGKSSMRTKGDPSGKRYTDNFSPLTRSGHDLLLQSTQCILIFIVEL